MKIAALLVSAFLVVGSVIKAQAQAQPDAPRSKPNIVLIMADDLGYGAVGSYGGKQVRTPNIDRLAARGVRLTDFHSNGPMCSPTRAALITGRYPQRCLWVDDQELSPVYQQQRKANPAQRWAWGISPKELTVGSVLQQAGYRTAIIGKWHLGYDLKFHPMNYGFDEFRGFVGGAVNYHTHVATHGQRELDWWKDRKIENEEGYTTDLLTRYATEFIERNKDKPFFLYFAQAAPHDPWQGRSADSKKSPEETYKEMIEILDESVGVVSDTLRKNNLERNTLLIFCSDNGPQAPRGFPSDSPLQGRKGSMLEGGHRVPFIASWPGVIPEGATRAQTVMTMDLFPTFASLAGAKIPADRLIDGTDIMPALTRDAAIPARNLHWRFGQEWAVRKGEWKLTGKAETITGLFKLDQDLAEQKNIAKDQAELSAELLELHRQWTAEAGDR